MIRKQAERIVDALDLYLVAKRDWDRHDEMSYDAAVVRKALNVAREALVVSLEAIPTGAAQ